MNFQTKNETGDIEHWRTICINWLNANQPFDAAHDFAHLQRVVKNASNIAAEENADALVVEVAAWLHDCVIVAKSSPLRSEASRMAAAKANDILKANDFPEDKLAAVLHAIEAHSFSAGLAVNSIEAACLRDADRLDAIGAVGLYRVIAAGAQMGRPLYNVDDPFCSEREPNDQCAIIDHFYTKLLTLEESMLTKTGKREASRRTRYLQGYLDELRYEIETIDSVDA